MKSLRRKKDKTYTGIEITATGLMVATLEYHSQGWRLLRSKQAAFPEQAIIPSLEAENIFDRETLISIIRDTLTGDGGGPSTVGLALPNESMKMCIQAFSELSGTPSDIDKMIAWTIERTYNFQSGSTTSSFQKIDTENGAARIFVSTGITKVIQAYEGLLKSAGIHAVRVAPSAVTQFNFYSSAIPPEGTIAYLGLFNDFSAFYVFQSGSLIFYQGLKKGMANDHFLYELDMCIENHIMENPGCDIDKLYLGGYSGERQTVQEIFGSVGSGYMEIAVLDETGLVVGESDTSKSLASFAAAIGAAQSLMV